MMTITCGPAPKSLFTHLGTGARSLLLLAAFSGAGLVALPAVAADQVPIRTIAGGATGIVLPYGIALDASGLLYVGNESVSSVTVYAAGANGGVAPIRTIQGPSTGISNPHGIALDPGGNLYVSNFGNQSITVYAPGANGDVLPSRKITGGKTGLNRPHGLELDASGNLYVANFNANAVYVYGPGANGDVAPVRIIQGGNTGLSSPQDLTLDTAGNLYVSSMNAHSVVVYAAGADGNVAPIRTITGANTGLTYPHGVGLDPNGALYVAVYAGWVNVYAAGANGDVAPIRTIQGPNTGLSGPVRVALAADGTVYTANFNSYAVTVYGPPPCGNGVPVTTGAAATWQQLALPCQPSASTASVANVLGNGQTANLSAASYGSQWILYGRNATNSGNVALGTGSLLSPGEGYWIKSLVPPKNGVLTVAGAATTVQTDVPDCPSASGCVVVSVNTSSAGSRMIGNPFPYNVEWSKVRVRVIDNINGTKLYTPSAAFAAGILDKQIWIWNGNDYTTWDDAGTPGNLQYFKSFFVKVLAGGVGQTIEILIPAEASTLAAAAPAARSWATALLDWLIPSAAADDGDWQIRLQVDNPKTHATTRALLGQRAAAADGYDSADLSAMAPFASPYLTLVFPQPAWGSRKGDYATDFRSNGGWPGTWTLELRTDPVGAPVVLRWEGDAAVLARSRLTDGLTGKVIDPSDPAYAQGYPLTLTTKVRRLTWEYLGQ